MNSQFMRQSLLFDDIPNFDSQGIKYAGSKQKLLPNILSIIAKTGAKSVFDGFSGSTRVSQVLAANGYDVISNDKAVWSKVMANCYLKNRQKPSFYESVINELNRLEPTDGWFSKNYGGVVGENASSIGLDGFKKPWQIHNTRKLDAIRQAIDAIEIGIIEKDVLLTSLILALDEVDNTIGHFSSYLEKWSPRSFKTLRMKVPAISIYPEGKHQVFCADIFDLLPKIEVDLAYLDPPYGSSNDKMPPSRIRYQGYYHVWKTICLNDQPEIFGKAARRKDSSDMVSASIFEDFRCDEQGNFLVVLAIEKLIKEMRAKFILLSYSSGGRATAKQLSEILAKNGEIIEVQKIDHPKNVMSMMRWSDEWIQDSCLPHQEFLFLLKKRF